MTRRPRRDDGPSFKANVALAALKGAKTMSDLATLPDVHPNQTELREDQLLDGVTDVFDDKPTVSKVPRIDIESLHARIGRLTLETGPCIEALEEAMRRHSTPEIMNTDQASQLTSIDFIKTSKDAGIQISMAGKGAWRDNVLVGRLWRTIKHEELYLRAYDRVSAGRESLARYLTLDNLRRPNSSLDGKTADQANLNPSRPIPVAE